MRAPRGLEGHRLDHVGIAVTSMDAAGAFDALGCVRAGPDETVPGQGVVVRLLRAGEVAIELLAPTAPDTPVGRFLARRGPGLHHLAFAVDDVVAEIDRLRALGAAFVTPAPRPGRGGGRVAFIHPSWAGGVLIELVEHR